MTAGIPRRDPQIPSPISHIPYPRAKRASDTPLLGWSAAVMRDGRAIHDRGDLEAGRLQRADGGFAASARPAHEDADLAHAVLHRLLGGGIGSQAGGVRRALARALEAGRSGRAPGEHVAVGISDGHDGVVEAGLDVGVAARHVLALAT